MLKPLMTEVMMPAEWALWKCEGWMPERHVAIISVSEILLLSVVQMPAKK